MMFDISFAITQLVLINIGFNFRLELIKGILTLCIFWRVIKMRLNIEINLGVKTFTKSGNGVMISTSFLFLQVLHNLFVSHFLNFPYKNI
jgi:hypothetical protein